MGGTTGIDNAFGDFDVSFDRLLEGRADDDERRRALDAALQCLYSLREYLKEAMGKDAAGNFRYYDLTNGLREGAIAEGVIAVRGFRAHSIAAPIEPKFVALLPGFLPGSYTYPGANLTWVEVPAEAAAKLQASGPGRKALQRYKAGAEGEMVLYSLQHTREFLRAHIA
ncbi:hypothetical protein GS482_21315 [Rhodococcus hoagii]|nr:hypothetical protein [Prescottella equi]